MNAADKELILDAIEGAFDRRALLGITNYSPEAAMELHTMLLSLGSYIQGVLSQADEEGPTVGTFLDLREHAGHLEISLAEAEGRIAELEKEFQLAEWATRYRDAEIRAFQAQSRFLLRVVLEKFIYTLPDDEAAKARIKLLDEMHSAYAKAHTDALRENAG